MKQTIFYILIIVALSINVFSQSEPSQEPNSAGRLTEAYEKLFFTVKSKNTDEIKQNMSKKTIEFCEQMAERKKEPVANVYRNGLPSTTFSEDLPRMKNERIENGFGALEVERTEGKWKDLPFVFEDGSWKLAIGEIFSKTYKKPESQNTP
jgi:hypothetical protein